MSIQSLMVMIIMQHLNWLKSLLKQGTSQSVSLHLNWLKSLLKQGTKQSVSLHSKQVMVMMWGFMASDVGLTD